MQQITTSDYAEHKYDNFYYFFVKLVGADKKKEIILSEFKEYSKAEKLLLHIEERLNIEAKVKISRTERLNS